MQATEMQAVERLFAESRALDHSPEMDRLFFDAMGEMVDWHRTRSALYDGICRLDGFAFEQLRGPEDLHRVPHIIVSAFKERLLLSLPQEEIAHHFTSSGTTGSMSQVNLDEVSFQRQSFTRRSIVGSYGLISDQPVNCLCFSYDPASGGERGAAHTHTAYSEFAPVKGRHYAISLGPDGKPRFDLEGCVRALEGFAQSGLPLRVTGFPAFGYTTLKRLDEQGERFRFPAESLLFSGGGWKLSTGEPVAFSEYVALVDRVLGIPAERVRDVYGMVEHGIPYLTCEQGNFHVPVYSRVYSVDPASLAILPHGQVGLFKLLTPCIRSQPSLSVLATDWGAVERSCPCGRSGDYLRLAGRAGVKKYDGCAISAAQLLGQ